MPFYNYRCEECNKIYKKFHDSSFILTNKSKCCDEKLIKVMGSFHKKDDDAIPVFQTSEDCLIDSKTEVIRELEEFKEAYKDI